MEFLKDARNRYLLGMYACYLSPVLYVYWNSQNKDTVSNIICDEKCKHMILLCLLGMSGFTILYESHRIPRSDSTKACMIALLISLFGVITIEEINPFHTLAAAISFISIMCFICIQSYLTKDRVLWFLLGVQFAFAGHSIWTYQTGNIFTGEVGMIMNFAIFYMILHLISP